MAAASAAIAKKPKTVFHIRKANEEEEEIAKVPWSLKPIITKPMGMKQYKHLKAELVSCLPLLSGGSSGNSQPPNQTRITDASKRQLIHSLLTAHFHRALMKKQNASVVDHSK